MRIEIQGGTLPLQFAIARAIRNNSAITEIANRFAIDEIQNFVNLNAKYITKIKASLQSLATSSEAHLTIPDGKNMEDVTLKVVERNESDSKRIDDFMVTANRVHEKAKHLENTLMLMSIPYESGSDYTDME